jgi:hypothetical protein
MATLQCLLCDARFDKPANHFCARECRPSTGQHVDFCRACRAACLRALTLQRASVTASGSEPAGAESAVRDRREDRRDL